MKKTFLHLRVIFLSIIFSSFIKTENPSSLSVKFKYQISSHTASLVANVDNWTYDQAASCSSSNVKACSFIITDDKYVHGDGLGGYILNNQTYISGSPEPGYERATIAVVEGVNSGVFIVITGGLGPTSIVNKVN